MKVQELMEYDNNEIHFNSYEEYKNFFETKSRDDSMYHFEDISAVDGNEYDILVKVYSYDDHGEGRVSVDWQIVGHGSGNYDSDTDFWVKEGRPDIDPKYDSYIESQIIEDQSL